VVLDKTAYFFALSDIIIELHFRGIVTTCPYNASGILYEFLYEYSL